MALLMFLGFLVLGILSLRGVRWAYITYVLLGLLYFPAGVGFRLDPQPCEVALSIPLAIHSLTNYAHLVLFVWFFLMDERTIPNVSLVGFCLGRLSLHHDGGAGGVGPGRQRSRSLSLARFDSRHSRNRVGGRPSLSVEPNTRKAASHLGRSPATVPKTERVGFGSTRSICC